MLKFVDATLCCIHVFCVVDVDWSKGACSGTVYSGDEKIANLMAKVIVSNALTLYVHRIAASFFSYFAHCDALFQVILTPSLCFVIQAVICSRSNHHCSQ
jgi:hypothetical protein